MIDLGKLREIWEKESPCCRSCGWCNAFFELEDAIEIEEENDVRTVYSAPCRSKDADDAYTHRGYLLYVPKDKP